ncbi:MAG TPA: hypothetical protein VNH11_30810 [Pirellulales bacterium]|nr:hypothetical protein [Pirellulales bacterium]
MATEQEHIELANRNHDAIRALLDAQGDHPEWVATIAFYKALQIVEATFAWKGLGHGHGHSRRLEILQDAKNGYSSLCKHYEALMEASEVARYLGARSSAGAGYARFSDYMSMAAVRDKLLKKRLMNVEVHARRFLSDDSKKILKNYDSLFS